MLKEPSTENFWTWAQKDGTGYDRYAYLGLDKCVNFKKEIWFELGKCMSRNHQSVNQDHLKYVWNYIVKTFYVRTLRYAKRVMEMHDLENYLPPPSMKGEKYEADNWKFHKQELTVSEI